MKILHLDSSPLGAASVSRQLSAALVERLRRAHPQAHVTYRDLVALALPHLSPQVLPIIRPSPDSQASGDPALRAEADCIDTLLREFLEADIVVIGAPMINFTIPSQLKAWFDRVLQAGRTFRYTAEGPVGLAGGKKVYVVSTRGGTYAGTAMETAMDHQEAWLRAVLQFIGITDITWVRAEGLALGEEQKARALQAAHEQIERLDAREPRAA
jgi:FMN-dependent NADH-azoreductase